MTVSERYSRMIQIVSVWGLSCNREACSTFWGVVNCSYELFILKCMPWRLGEDVLAMQYPEPVGGKGGEGRGEGEGKGGKNSFQGVWGDKDT